MEATAVVKKIVTELFEHKKFIDGYLASKTDAYNHLDGQDSEEEDEIEQLDNIMSSYEDLITEMKDAFNIEDLEIED